MSTTSDQVLKKLLPAKLMYTPVRITTQGSMAHLIKFALEQLEVRNTKRTSCVIDKTDSIAIEKRRISTERHRPAYASCAARIRRSCLDFDSANFRVSSAACTRPDAYYYYYCYHYYDEEESEDRLGRRDTYESSSVEAHFHRRDYQTDMART